MIDLAIAFGRGRQSPQTGYLHFYYGADEQEPSLTIPTVENFFFALALLRSRNVDQVNEAKTLLDNLLHFQNLHDEATLGNFPIYLHEYPACKDRFVGIHVACVIYWILKQYHQGLGSDLRSRLEAAFTSATKQALQTHHEKNGNYAVALKIAAVAKSGGEFLKNDLLAEQGSALLAKLEKERDFSAWCCPKSIGIMLSALSILYPKIGESPWKAFWSYLQETWHRKTCSYIGPATKEWQSGYEPQVTLYDMFLGYFSEAFSKRALKPSIAHLEAVLILCSDESFPKIAYPFFKKAEENGVEWTTYQDASVGYSIITKKNFPEMIDKGYHSLKLVWGSSDYVHTFVCQGGNSVLTEFSAQAKEIILTFDLGQTLDVEDKEKSRDVIFFTDIHEGIEFLVEGEKSSTFRLGEKLDFKDSAAHLQLSFDLKGGEGNFVGHRMLGNRPSQIDSKGSKRYSAYDWQLFLRTVGRSPAGKVAVKLSIESL